jgi:PadR family transcriptional regulator, regulatory protein PadR
LTRYLYLDRFSTVVRNRGFSGQTLSVLGVLCAEPLTWRHGYDIARETGLKSGTLYPILMRLADRGLLEACWEDEQPAGRPRRHLYRLTSEGLARSSEALAAAPAPARTAGKPRRTVGQTTPEGA